MKKILSHLLPILKYASVGSVASIIDLGLLYLFVEYGKIPILLAATFSFVCALFVSFFLHKFFTFKVLDGSVLRQYIKFFLTSGVGLSINTLILYLLVYHAGVWYIFAKIIAAGFVFIWNFSVNRYWTFRIIHIARQSFPSPDSEKEISIIIPAYNEEMVIEQCIASVRSFFEKKNMRYEIIVVDDGSTDMTRSRAEKSYTEGGDIHVLSYEKNKGKGYAVRTGVLAARGDAILFIDADCSTPIDAYDALVPYLSQRYGIVIGSRYLKESAIHIRQPKRRIILGRIGNMLIRLLLLQGIYDTQCGFKLFSATAAKSIFLKQSIDRWGFDMEVLALGMHMGFHIKEVPVSWQDDTRRISRFRPIRDAYKTLGELFKIKMNLMFDKYR
ncbi:glycosyltransferase [Candidatus Uhrbacteria bacterium]|nr:glycosyltransferase [Candidatus Uhrbacteria bacterium]